MGLAGICILYRFYKQAASDFVERAQKINWSFHSNEKDIEQKKNNNALRLLMS